MKKRLAHMLRRATRRMIAWSNRLDAPYAGHQAGMAVEGLMEQLGTLAKMQTPEPTADEPSSILEQIRDAIHELHRSFLAVYGALNEADR